MQLINKHPHLKDAALFEATSIKNSPLTYKLIGMGAAEKYAACGAGFSHWIAFLHSLDLSGEVLNWALDGAAIGGHDALVECLLSYPNSDIVHAIHSAAKYGHFYFTWNLLGKNKIPQPALFGAMIGEQVELLNALTRHYNTNGIDKYIFYNYSNDFKPTHDHTLHFIALLDDFYLRKKVASSACERNSSLDFKQLMLSANKLNKLIRHGYNYPQAKALENSSAFIWGFYAPHIINKKDMNDEHIQNSLPKLPVEIYLYICSYIFGLNDNETYKLHNKLNRRLHAQVLAAYSPGIVNNLYAFFSLEKEAKLAECKKNFEDIANKRLKKRLLECAGDIEETLPLQMRRDN